MRYDKSAAGRQLTLLLEGLELPADEIECDQFLQDFEAAIEAVLTEHDLDADRLRAIGGHSYSAIAARCPVCGSELELIEPSLDPYNGAYARAGCECDWSGEAVYRLIDLREFASDSTDHSSGDEKSGSSIFDVTNSVSLYELEPRYYPY